MKNTSNTKVKALIWILIGVGLLFIPFIFNYCIEHFNWSIEKDNLFVLLINNVCPAFATIALLSFAWEIMSKRSFAKEVLEIAKVADNYIDSGIEYVYNEFTEIDWKEMFKDSKKVICFFTYAYSWRSNNRSAINMLKKQNTDVTIILPDYNDADIVNTLNKDFKYSKYADQNSEGASKNVKNLIKEAEEYFKNFGATVKLYKGNIKSTYYFIDNKCIFAPFKHGGKKSSVPAILCKEGGTFFDFCKRDINAIIEESQ